MTNGPFDRHAQLSPLFLCCFVISISPHAHTRLYYNNVRWIYVFCFQQIASQEDWMRHFLKNYAFLVKRNGPQRSGILQSFRTKKLTSHENIRNIFLAAFCCKSVCVPFFFLFTFFFLFLLSSYLPSFCVALHAKRISHFLRKFFAPFRSMQKRNTKQ